MNLIANKASLAVLAAATALVGAGCAAERIDPNDFDQVAPAYNGDDVVWEDSRNDATAGTDVYRFTVSTATETKVAGGTGEQDQPAISDQYVVWIDRGTLKAESLQPGSTPFNVTTGSASPVDPAVCGSLVVWSDTANNSDVYARNLPNGPLITVATSPAAEAYPACDQGRVVYTYAPLGGGSDIHLYDVGTGHTSVVSDEIWNEWRPSISGNRVVWQAWPAQPDTTQGFDLFGKNLDTGQGFVVSTALGNQSAPVISGSTVAWEDTVQHQPSGLPQIWWRDVATTMPQNGIPVDNLLTGKQLAPSIVGRQVVFQSDFPGPWNIYGAQLFFFAR
jgi:hypothetical protein